MTTRSPDELYAALIAAGFDAASAQTMTAIGLAESGGNDTAVGDVSLQNATWGPSIGVWQIRTQKSQTGSGGVRDIAALSGDLLAQAKAAYAISNGGTKFTDWSVFNSGKWTKFRSVAAEAASSIAARARNLGVSLADAAGGLLGIVGSPTDALSSLVAGSLNNVKALSVQGIAALFGVALIGVGLTVAVMPKVRARVARNIDVGVKAAGAVL